MREVWCRLVPYSRFSVIKNKKSEECLKNCKLKVNSKALILAFFQFTWVSDLEKNLLVFLQRKLFREGTSPALFSGVISALIQMANPE